MAKLAYRSTARTVDLTFGNSSLAGTAPAGVAAGDAVIAASYNYAFAPSVPPTVSSVPSGFTEIGADQVVALTSVNARVTMWEKLAGGSEPSTYTFQYSGATGIQLIISALDNAPLSGPIGQAFGTVTVETGTTSNGSGVTTNKTNQKLLFFSGNSVASTHTPPSGMTERYDASNNTIADEDIVAPGPTGNRSGSWSASGEHATFLLALYSEDSRVIGDGLVTGIPLGRARLVS